MRAYRMHGPVASEFSRRKAEGEPEVMWQIRRFHSFIWASGGCFSDFYIHQIDETSWMKNAWPVICWLTARSDRCWFSRWKRSISWFCRPNSFASMMPDIDRVSCAMAVLSAADF